MNKAARAKRNDSVFPLADVYAYQPWWVRWQLGTNRVVPDKVRSNADRGRLTKGTTE